MATEMGADAHDATGFSSQAAAFKAQGLSFVAQYIDQYSDANTGGSPSVTAAQIQQETSAGLNIVSIFQTNGMSSSAGNAYQTYFTDTQGTADAHEAVTSAMNLGQPAGSTIYFAMDFDPAIPGAAGTEANLLSEVRTYLGSVGTVLHQAGYNVGVYGAGDTLAAAIHGNPPVAQYGWLTQSYGWAGSNPQTDTNAQGWDLYQGMQTTQNGVAIDPDTATSNSFGSWTVCYRSGTRIRTTRGDIAVEVLDVGDLVVTASGEQRPIRWLGHRTIDCRHHDDAQSVHPVRIAARAFGPDRPARDLFVSPGHAICIDVIGEVLVPARALVNGSTITQVDVDEVTYWHVELDSHDILLAENMPAESYMDVGNRSFFQESGVVAFEAVPDAPARTHADFCRPVHLEGPLVEVVRARLRRQAETLGWVVGETPFADVHLVIDGQRIDPVTRGWSVRFHVPAGAQDVWLVSQTSRPCDVRDSRDTRDLGICVTGIAIEDGFAQHRVELHDPLLSTGFHDVEDGILRWTAGRARLPAALWEACPHDLFLRVDLAGAAIPRWTRPDPIGEPWRFANPLHDLLRRA